MTVKIVVTLLGSLIDYAEVSGGKKNLEPNVHPNPNPYPLVVSYL